MGTKFVYFLEASGLSAVKIGVTDDLTRRIRTLQCGCPVPLRLLCLIPEEEVSETFLHGKFSHLSIDGVGKEWFHFTSELRQFIEGINQTRKQVGRILSDASPNNRLRFRRREKDFKEFF